MRIEAQKNHGKWMVKTWKGQADLLHKAAQVAAPQNLCPQSSYKLKHQILGLRCPNIWRWGWHFFRKKRSKKSAQHRWPRNWCPTLRLIPKNNAVPRCNKCEVSSLMREGDTFRNLDNPCHRFGSLGLNLACKGLLLGIRDEGPTRLPQGVPTHVLEPSPGIQPFDPWRL
jgi:hypothetical protein